MRDFSEFVERLTVDERAELLRTLVPSVTDQDLIDVLSDVTSIILKAELAELWANQTSTNG